MGIKKVNNIDELYDYFLLKFKQLFKEDSENIYDEICTNLSDLYVKRKILQDKEFLELIFDISLGKKEPTLELLLSLSNFALKSTKDKSKNDQNELIKSINNYEIMLNEKIELNEFLCTDLKIAHQEFDRHEKEKKKYEVMLEEEDKLIQNLTKTYAESILVNSEEWDNQMKIQNDINWLNRKLLGYNSAYTKNNFYQNCSKIFYLGCFCTILYINSKYLIYSNVCE